MNEKRKLREHPVVVKRNTSASSIKYASCKDKFSEKENYSLQRNIDGVSYKVTKTQNQLKQKAKKRVTKHKATPETKSSPRQNYILKNVENIPAEKNLNTNKKRSKNINLETIPIYKRNLHLLNPRKKRHCGDVYDISLEEDMTSSKPQTIKKKINTTKSKIKNNGEKKKHFTLNFQLKGRKLHNSKLDSTPASSIHKISSKKQVCVETNKLIVSQISLSNEKRCDNEVCVEQNSFSVSSPNDIIDETMQYTLTDLQSSELKDKNKMYLSNLAEEFEKSFSLPKMTSTPDAIHSKIEKQTKKNKVSIADISNIPAYSRNSTIISSTPDSTCSKIEIQTQKNKISSIPDTTDVPVNNENCVDSQTFLILDNDVSPETGKIIEEITLFESPTKSRTKEKNPAKATSPRKTIQLNLFGEALQTPSGSSSTESLEESVIMPKKAYHSPNNFKTHLIRTKRPIEKSKKEPKKSKQDLLIESLSKHFEEIENTDLCVE